MSSSSTTTYATADSTESNTIIKDRGSAIPRTCSECGIGVVIQISRTTSNPGCHFFGCPISKILFFKWVDETMLEEIELLTNMFSDLRVHMCKLEVERKQEREMASALIIEAQSLKSTIVNLEKNVSAMDVVIAMEAFSAKGRTYKHLKLTDIMLGCLVGVVFYCVLGCKCKTK